MGKFHGLLVKVRKKTGRDSAVAEIIGVVLIFAILISLFTTFILWYVPATGTANEQHYDQQTQNAFYRFADGLSDTNVPQGQTSSYSFPLGVQGVPPFSPANPTAISFSKKYDNFSSSMSFRLTITYTPSGGKLTYYNTTVTHHAQGVFRSIPQTQFTIPTSYDIQDGFLIQIQGNSNPALGVGPLPISVNGTSGSISTVGAYLLNVTGQSVTASEVGSTLVTLHYGTVNQTRYTAGEFTAINGTTGTIGSITLDSFHYNITSVYAEQWNYALYQDFNNSAATFGQASSLSTWNFGTGDFVATVHGERVDVSGKVPVVLNAVDFTYVGLGLSSI